MLQSLWGKSTDTGLVGLLFDNFGPINSCALRPAARPWAEAVVGSLHTVLIAPRTALRNGLALMKLHRR